MGSSLVLTGGAATSNGLAGPFEVSQIKNGVDYGAGSAPTTSIDSNGNTDPEVVTAIFVG